MSIVLAGDISQLPQVTGKVQKQSSHRRCSVKKGVLRNFAKVTGKHLFQSLFYDKVVGQSYKAFYRTHPDECFLKS